MHAMKILHADRVFVFFPFDVKQILQRGILNCFHLLLVRRQALANVTGDDVVLELGVVFVRLDDEEHRAQGQRDGDVHRHVFHVALDRGVMSEHDGEATANQHKGIDRADGFVQMHLMRRRPRVQRIGRRTVAQNEVRANERREEHDFRDKE